MEQMPPQLCLSLLKSSVRDVSKLRQVNTTANLDLAKGGSPFNFENYLSLLLASVTLYDKGNNLSNSCSPKNKRSAFVAETIFPNDDYGIDYNIDYLRPFCTKRVRTTVEQETKIKTARAMSTVNNRIFPVKCGINCLMMQRRSLEACLLPRKVKPHLTASQHPRFHANSHSLTDMGHPFPSDNSLNESNKDKFHDCGNNTELLAHLTDRLSPMANGDIRKVLASASSHKQKQNVKNSLQSNMLKYSISRHSVVGTKSSLIDRGANGGLAGTDVKVINKTGRLASIIGVNGHSLSDLDIVTAAGLVESQNGPIIVKLHQYAHHGKGKTIHSSAQLEYYKNTVKDRSCVFGGTCIHGHAPSFDAEFDTLPHVVLTSNVNWDPSIIDNEIDLATDWYDAVQDLPTDPYVEPCFNLTGDCRHRHVANFDIFSSPEIIARSTAIDSILSSNKHDMVRNERNYNALRPCLG